MRLLKPAWVSHEGKPIFSIDIHPDGSRFATGGQGDNSGKVVVWNMAPVCNEEAEKDENVPKMLCCMDNHQACVNCVRWSHDGKFLASGGDDKIIMIWVTGRSGGGAASFGSNAKFTNVEQWRVASMLRGHQGDILDLAWSPHDAWLASSSIDNTITVWNAHKFPEALTVLRGHTGLVKGVTWDPIGKYLASQSDDRTLRVWRTVDWTQEACINEPFKECGGTTHVLRLNWSPDGHYIVSSHAMNNSGPVAQIVERDGWRTSLDFVGHRKAITVVRFNQNIFSKKLKKSALKPSQYSCCAIGSRDRSLSIWLTALKRPLCVVHDLFKNSILDISWSKSGLGLLACSWDGTVAYADFEESELGRPLDQHEVVALHTNTYGSSLVGKSAADGNKPANQIIESAAMLNMQQPQKGEGDHGKAEDSKVPADCQTSNMSTGSTPQTPSKQIETRTKDGKRRIVPIFLAPQPDIASGDIPLPFGGSNPLASGSAAREPVFSSTKEKTTISVEKMDKLPPDMLNQAKLMSPPPAARVSTEAAEKPTTPVVVTEKTQTTLIQPLEVEKRPVEKKSPLSEKSRTEDRGAGVKLVKRKLDTDDSSPSVRKKDGRGRPRKDRARDAERRRSGNYSTEPMNHQPAAPPVVQKETKIVYTNSGLDLAVPRIDKSHTVQISGVSGEPSHVALHIENCVITPGSATLHKAACTVGGSPAWDSLLNSRINIAAGNGHVVAVGCEDGSLHLLSVRSGRRLLPPLQLDAACHRLTAAGRHLMAVTARGTVHVWDVVSLRATLPGESLAAVVRTSDVAVHSSVLTEAGIPVVTLSTGASYTYCTNLRCWLCVSPRSSALAASSDHRSSLPASEASLRGPLAALTAARKPPSASSLHRAPPGLAAAATLTHLETQVAAATALRSPAELHFWLMTYVRYLVQHGEESKLRELCDDLLGPVFKSKSATDPKWEDTTLGYKKRGLLAEILPLLAANLSLQRVYTEYKEQLDAVSD